MISFKEFLTEAKRPQSEVPWEVDTEIKPKKTKTVYKLFQMDADNDPHTLYVGSDHKVPVGQWLKAKAGEKNANGKIKAKLAGGVAERPGWHSAYSPSARHIGSLDETGKVAFRRPNERWAECEVADDIDYNPEAQANGRVMKNGKKESSTCQITNHVPEGGSYDYNTGAKREAQWNIAGHVKINRFLEDHEVEVINKKNGLSDLPRKPIQ